MLSNDRRNGFQAMPVGIRFDDDHQRGPRAVQRAQCVDIGC